MHKHRARSMQRYHKVHEIDVQPSGYRTQDDLLPGVDSMPLPDCEAERGRLMHEKTRAEQDLVVAKRAQNTREIGMLGLRIQGLCNRIAQVKARTKQIRAADEYGALKQAIFEVLDAETLHLVIARKEEIRRAMPLSPAVPGPGLTQ